MFTTLCRKIMEIKENATQFPETAFTVVDMSV